jgi:uncharacterized protein
MNEDIQGCWRGWLDSGVARIQLSFRIESEAARLHTAAGDLILPARRRRRRLHLAAPILDIALVLRPDARGERLIGTCRHGRAAFPIAFERGERLAEPRRPRPQTPQPPFRYQAEEVSFAGTDGARRTGTLTRPEGPVRSAVVLSSWYGRVDRDQTVAGHRPMAIWADALTRRGFATLRYDKRGTGGSEGDFERATTGDFAEDLACAVGWLRDRPGIDADRIGLLGHSEGAHISAEVAAMDRRIAFCVAMTPSGAPEELSFESELFRPVVAVGGRPWFPTQVMASLRSIARIVRQAETEAQAEAELIVFLNELVARGRFQAERVASYARMAASPWRRYWWNYDQTAGLRGLACPVLVVMAGLDLQTPPRAHGPSIRAALAGNPRAETVEFPALNHFLQTARTGAPSEYAMIDETLAPAVVQTVCDWIARTMDDA